MHRFWVKLWAYWTVWITLFSVVIGVLLSTIISAGIYLFLGAPAMDGEIIQALLDLAYFWFAPAWSIGLLAGLLLSLKRLFFHCFDGYQLVLYGCDGDALKPPLHLEETLKAWRKWFFLTVWIVAIEVVGGVGIALLFGYGEGLMGWFSIYWLYLFILCSALVTLPLMASRCKMVKVERC